MFRARSRSKWTRRMCCRGCRTVSAPRRPVSGSSSRTARAGWS
nr:MAG TPA: Cation-transporting ATPase [Caudoviricetes sp.]